MGARAFVCVQFKMAAESCSGLLAQSDRYLFKIKQHTVFCPGFQKGRVPSQKGTFSAVNGLSKGHFSAVNGLKRAL